MPHALCLRKSAISNPKCKRGAFRNFASGQRPAVISRLFWQLHRILGICWTENIQRDWVIQPYGWYQVTDHGQQMFPTKPRLYNWDRFDFSHSLKPLGFLLVSSSLVGSLVPSFGFSSLTLSSAFVAGSAETLLSPCLPSF